MKINLEKKFLSENDKIAIENKKFFDANGVYVLNVMGSPGSGKTSLLEITIPALQSLNAGVIEGDVETDRDTQRIKKLTPNVIQIETHGACHLNASWVADASKKLMEYKLDIMFIENIGNLVCPSGVYLGEDARVIVLSVTEGEDKPVKYPGIFVHADAVIVNKIDLLDYVSCDIDTMRNEIKAINQETAIFEVSCTSASGVEDFTIWLREKVLQKNKAE